MSTCICRGFSHDPNCPMTPRPETDAPAATTLRDLARTLDRQHPCTHVDTEVTAVACSQCQADALLPLLRAQARRDALNEAARVFLKAGADNLWRGFEVFDLLARRAEQDTPDQANT